MALLEHLAVTEISDGRGSFESIPIGTGNAGGREKGESSSEAEDNSRTRHRRKKVNETDERVRTQPRHKHKSRVKWSVGAESQAENKHISDELCEDKEKDQAESKYKAVDIPELNLKEVDADNRIQKDDVQDSESSFAADNHRGKRRKRKSKAKTLPSESYVDPLQQKYMELNQLLMKDFVEKKLAEHRKLSSLYKPLVARLQGRPPMVSGTQQGPQSISLHQPSQRKWINITMTSDGGSDASTNNGRRKETVAPKSASEAKVGLTKRRRPHSATIQRRSRADEATRNLGNGGRRSRSAGGRRPVRRGKSASTSDRSDSVSGGKTDTDTCSSPRRIIVPIDCHLKKTQNEEMLSWLQRKNQLLREEKRKRKEKKQQQRIELMDKATAMYERSVASKKETEEWFRKKKREAWLKTKEDKLAKDLRNKEALQNKNGNFSAIDKTFTKTDSVHLKNGSDVNAHDRLEQEEHEQAIKAAEFREKGPFAPNTTFIYKRPVTGKIRFKMPKVTKPVPERSEPKAPTEGERREQARMSYDRWLQGKRNEELKKKMTEQKKENALANSDPMVHVLSEAGKKRVQSVYERKKTMDSGLPQARDDSTEFRIHKPKNSAHQDKRKPTPSSRSPRRVNNRLEKIMENDSKINPFILPFPPELGVPRHVAAKQREIFGEKVWNTAPEKPQTEKKDESVLLVNTGSPGNEDKTGEEQGGGQNDERDEDDVDEDADDDRTPRYGFNRQKSPISTSSSDNEGVKENCSDKTAKNTDFIPESKSADVQALERDSFFLTSIDEQ